VESSAKAIQRICFCFTAITYSSLEDRQFNDKLSNRNIALILALLFCVLSFSPASAFAQEKEFLTAAPGGKTIYAKAVKTFRFHVSV
jgi:hypothetical protein